MRPQFADILAHRREQLGLTIPQAANVLRMRESVLEAFEAGDFGHLPPLGYAQGMVSSYARYLGLDPAQLTDLYEREHSDYVLEMTGRRPSGLANLSDEPGITGPASGARSSSQGQGAQIAVDPVAASRARVGQAPLGESPAAQTGRLNRKSAERTNVMRPTSLPQRYNTSPGYGVEGSFSANQGSQDSNYAADRRYSSQLRYGDNNQTATFAEGYESTRSNRRYTSRAPERSDERARRGQAERVRRMRSSEDHYSDDYAASRSSSYNAGARRSSGNYQPSYDSDIETRDVNSQYRDDLRYDSGASNYRASSTREGREGARNMQMPGRIENARRRQNPTSARSRNRRQQQPQAQGFAGAFQQYFADPQRAILSIGVLLAIILLLILVFSVRSCIDANTGTGKQVSVVTTLAATSETAATTTSDLEQQVVSAAAAEKAASSAAAAYTETKVKVSVAEGATTWVEIICDGEQKIAESITGAWSAEYTVTQQIQIQVVDASSVTVEKNGEVQSFTSKSAGLSSMTIEGTDPEAAAAATAATTESDSSDDSSGDSSDSSDDYSSDDYSDEDYSSDDSEE